MTPLIRMGARRRLGRLASQDAAAVQEAVLLGLIRTASTTAFGRAHRFAAIGSVAEYQARVPLSRYEAFRSRWWQANFPYYQNAAWPGLIPYLAETPGTGNGTVKFLPVGKPMIRSNRAAAQDLLAFHLAARPGSRLPGGTCLLLGGIHGLRRRGPGVQSGDLGTLGAATMPGWSSGHWRGASTWPPRGIASLTDWDDKLDRIAAGALRRDIRAMAGTPGLLLQLFERLAARHPDHPHSLAGIFPGLELIVHGGAGFAPYKAAFDPWLQGSRAECREIYTASEGFIAAADRGPDEGLRLMLDHGLFMEFIAEEDLGQPNPRRFWIGDVEPGRDYALALTSNAGLWSMLIGDRVRLLGLDPPRILMTGRLDQRMSLFGEQVSDFDLDLAIASAAAATGCTIADYAAHGFLTADGRGRHLFAVEAAGGTIDARLFANMLDRSLRSANTLYATQRFADTHLLPPLVHVVPRGTFVNWLAQRRHVAGRTVGRHAGRNPGQMKVPRVLADQAMLAALLGVKPDALRLVLTGA